MNDKAELQTPDELRQDRKSRGETREDHLAAGRQMALDENQSRADEASALASRQTAPEEAMPKPQAGSQNDTTDQV